MKKDFIAAILLLFTTLLLITCQDAAKSTIEFRQGTLESIGRLNLIMAILIIICAVLPFLFSLSYKPKERKRYKILKWIYGRRAIVGSFMVISWILTGYIYYRKETLEIEIRKSKLEMESVQGPDGLGLISLQTIIALNKELENVHKNLANQARHYFKSGKLDFAENRFKSAAENFKKAIDVIPTLSGYNNLGASLFYIPDLIKAENVLDHGLQLARSNKKIKYEGIFLNNLGGIYIKQEKQVDALRNFEMADSIFQEADDELGQAHALYNIGTIFFTKDKQEEALEKLLKAFEIYDEYSDSLGQAMALNNIGIIFRRQGRIEEAKNQHYLAYDIFEQKHHLRGKASALGNLGADYAAEDSLENALTKYQSADSIFKQLNNKEERVKTLININNIFEKQGNYKKLIKSYHALLEVHKSTGDSLWIGWSLAHIGDTYFKDGNIDEALKYWLSASEILEKNDYPAGNAMLFKNIGVVFLDKGILDKAKDFLTRARKCYFEIADTNTIKAIDKTIAKIDSLSAVHSKK